MAFTVDDFQDLVSLAGTSADWCVASGSLAQ